MKKIIAIALNIPSNKAIFFNNFSVFEEILEGSNTLKIELTKLSNNIHPYYKLSGKHKIYT